MNCKQAKLVFEILLTAELLTASAHAADKPNKARCCAGSLLGI